jgi:hypothetical protein
MLFDPVMRAANSPLKVALQEKILSQMGVS